MSQSPRLRPVPPVLPLPLLRQRPWITHRAMGVLVLRILVLVLRFLVRAGLLSVRARNPHQRSGACRGTHADAARRRTKHAPATLNLGVVGAPGVLNLTTSVAFGTARAPSAGSSSPLVGARARCAAALIIQTPSRPGGVRQGGMLHRPLLTCGPWSAGVPQLRLRCRGRSRTFGPVSLRPTRLQGQRNAT